MNKIVAVVKCTVCKTVHNFNMTEDQHKRLTEGYESIQNVLPNLTPGERELLISGFCESCYDKIFGEEE